MNLKTIITALGCGIALFVSAQNKHSLVPDTPSKAPDYFCTWNLQGYLVSHQDTKVTRKAMNEDNLFGKGKYQNWANCYPRIREDLYLVLDDSWDIPKEVNDKPNPYLGTVELNEERFPSFHGTPEERLRQLVTRIKAKGWKGAGGWICAQKADNQRETDEKSYWTERIKTADEAGFDYWKVDWGNNDRNGKWRKMLTDIGKQYAPRLYIEHACENRFIEFSDVFRTYDVENVIAQPVTIQRICNLLPYQASANAKGLINCEDEPYIAAGLGCAIGIMRHPFTGNMPDGNQDIAFPPVGRDMKKRLDEVVRGIRWHRIAEPFGVNGKDFEIDNVRLEDYWILKEKETWMKSRKPGSKMVESAPARVSRGMPLPEVSDSCSADRPYILCSRYPNGAIAVASIGRSLNHDYISKRIGVTIPVPQTGVPIGVFGYFEELTIILTDTLNTKNYRVLAQDLAGDSPVNITKKIKIKDNRVTIPGELLSRIGLMKASKYDCSDPGLVIQIFRNTPF